MGQAVGKLLGAGDRGYESPRQQLFGLIVLALGMIIPGALLATNPTFWSTTQIVHDSLGAGTWMVQVLGVVLLASGIVSLVSKRSRDVTYVIGAVFYALIALAYTIALFQGVTIGAFFLSPLIVARYYSVAMSFTSQAREKELQEGRE